MKYLVFLFFFVSPLYASITDTAQELIIPQNETYILIGTHSYTNQIKINGTLYVGGYNGSVDSGRLNLISPSISISTTGKILADGKGYGSASGPGKGITGWRGTGGGYGGMGGGGSDISGGSILGGQVYGSIVEPLELGSGGGMGRAGRDAGGAGGGLIKLEVGNILSVDGTISANGIGYGCVTSYSNICGSGGSGGSVYIVTDNLEGNGIISSNGGQISSEGGGGGGGRILINTENSTNFIGRLESHGGTSSNSTSYGGAGTTYLVDQNKLVIDNYNIIGADTPFLDGNYNFSEVIISSKASVTISSAVSLECSNFTTTDYGKLTSAGSILITGSVTIGGEVHINSSDFNTATIEVVDKGALYLNSPTIARDISIFSEGTLYLNNSITANDINIFSGGIITHTKNINKFNLEVTNDLDIKQGGKISADGKGYDSASGPGKGINGWVGSGGGHGGTGGSGSDLAGAVTSGGSVYGSIVEPLELGSGGGMGRAVRDAGGAGGGLIKLEVGNRLSVDGIISANGAGDGCLTQYSNYCGSGGSGGSVYISANYLEGDGTISANGGSINGAGGGGAGGRIGIFYNTKQFNGNVMSQGGSGSSAGEKGTILDNGEIKSIVVNENSPTALTNSTETLGNETYLTETLTVQKSSIHNIITTGALNGIFDFSDIKFIKMKTGGFAGKGIAKGIFMATFDGINYNGELKGMLFDKEGKIHIKGAVVGDIRGVVEGEIINNQFKAVLNFKKLGINTISGQLSLTGFTNSTQIQEYPGIKIKLVQSNINGIMDGYLYYSSPFSAVFTHLKIDERLNPYYGEGFLSGSYSTNLGTAQNFAYSKEIVNGISSITGVMSNPTYGLMSGVLNEKEQERNWLINIERLDVGLPYGVELSLKVNAPDTVSPGQTVNYSIELINDSLKEAEKVSVIAIAPPYVDFVSASGDYKFYNIANWIGDKYEPIPFVRWDFENVSPKNTIKLNFQGKIRIGGPGPHEMLECSVHLIPVEKAEDIFPIYDPEGAHD